MKQAYSFLVLLLALMLPISAWADEPDLSKVVAGGIVIMRVREPAGGYSIQQRASKIQTRVDRILGEGPIDRSDITVEPAGHEAVVLVKEELLFTADLATAHLNQTPPIVLAEEWANHMRQVLPRVTHP